MFPHESALKKNSIAVTDLPEKTQKKIAKFTAETDEEKRESLDESIFGDIEDFIEAKNEKMKKEATKKKLEEEKAAIKAEKEKAAATKGTDLSDIPTASKPAPQAPATPPAGTPAPDKKGTSLYDRIYGRK